MLQCVAVCCSVLQCVAESRKDFGPLLSRPARRLLSVLQCAAVCCSVLQCVAVCCSVLQCVAVCCSVLQCRLGTFETTLPLQPHVHFRHKCRNSQKSPRHQVYYINQPNAQLFRIFTSAVCSSSACPCSPRNSQKSALQ